MVGETRNRFQVGGGVGGSAPGGGGGSTHGDDPLIPMSWMSKDRKHISRFFRVQSIVLLP